MLNRIRALLTRRQPQQEPPLPNYGVRYFDYLVVTNLLRY